MPLVQQRMSLLRVCVELLSAVYGRALRDMLAGGDLVWSGDDSVGGTQAGCSSSHSPTGPAHCGALTNVVPGF
ncbi:hypothetical protein HPB50_025000 [Hyalomma asiaticum]|uniref:Uncharacterized protein n=1 Tax=Hyalomma asiaticum TaxID=266040 RepID=A0ACB7SZM1_HYAAI|nr:hypothetical protein HPB50_025000 [Hyalomma asiaticum]